MLDTWPFTPFLQHQISKQLKTNRNVSETWTHEHASTLIEELGADETQNLQQITLLFVSSNQKWTLWKLPRSEVQLIWNAPLSQCVIRTIPKMTETMEIFNYIFIYDLNCNQPLGGNWDSLASLLHVIHLWFEQTTNTVICWRFSVSSTPNFSIEIDILSKSAEINDELKSLQYTECIPLPAKKAPPSTQGEEKYNRLIPSSFVFFISCACFLCLFFTFCFINTYWEHTTHIYSVLNQCLVPRSVTLLFARRPAES